MSTTPEGKIKHMVKDLLAKVHAEAQGLYTFWPVPAGYGPSSLDCLICYYGVFVGVECKAPGKKPTPRQELTISQIRDAKGVTFVIDSEQDVERLRLGLEMIRFSYANHNQQEA